ncbi:MAG: hypothetical protein GXX79_13310 [Actinomycetales bacterium]|nr:hypothetical protein [Actinomycetales bacterium]
MSTDNPDPTTPVPETAGTAQTPPQPPTPAGQPSSAPPGAATRSEPGRWRRFVASPLRVGLTVFLATLLLVALPLGVLGFTLGVLVGSTDDDRHPGHCRIHDRLGDGPGDRSGDNARPLPRKGPWNLNERPGWQRPGPGTTPTPTPSPSGS